LNSKVLSLCPHFLTLITILNKIQLVKNILFAISILLSLSSLGQADSLKPAYLRFPTVPPFEILEVDSITTFSKHDLNKNQQLLLMYFSPDCDHCRHQTEDILRDIRSFKKIQVVMATFEPLTKLREFQMKYKLSDYNIHVGRDSKYILPPFYRMGNLPYLALYDKKGNLITTFEGNQKVNKILKAFGKGE